MRIGQLAELTGVSVQTIRFYERKGLLAAPERRGNGYRAYTEQHGERLAFVRRCRLLNLSLTEIRELQGYLDEPHQPCTAVNSMLDDRISHVQAQIESLQALEKQLVALRMRCHGVHEAADCGILTGISADEIRH
nr:Cd(II)/Pb(II)-responsive transcriptional regulator [uncultured Halomonas sp.]